MPRAERWLVRVLRFFGCITLLGFFAMFLPTAWMAATHARLGLGTFQASPLVEYLTRSIAGLYSLHGGVLVVVSCNVRRYAPLIGYLGAASVLFGAALIVIDLEAGLPPWWTIGEGPPLMAAGALILWLRRRAAAQAASR